MPRTNFKITFIIIVVAIVLLAACNTVKHVPDGQYLLQDTKIIVNDKLDNNPILYEYLWQKPNQNILGLPISLHAFNVGGEKFMDAYQEWKGAKEDSLKVAVFLKHFEKWKKEEPKAYRKLKKFFSDKQTYRYQKFKLATHFWFFKSFQTPVILDSVKTQNTTDNLLNHYINKGFLEAETSHEVSLDSLAKKVDVSYHIQTKDRYVVDSVSTAIKSVVLDSIFMLQKEKSFVKKGIPFDLDIFKQEQKRLFSLFRNSGIFFYDNSYMGYDYTKDTITKSTNVVLDIKERLIQDGDSVFVDPFRVRRMKTINITTDYSYLNQSQEFVDTVSYHGFNFRSYGKLKYNPKILANSIFSEIGEVYSDIDRDLTRRHLQSLKNFKSIQMKYSEDPLSGDLIADILLTPYDKYGFNAEAELIHSNVKRFGVSGKLSFLNRNTFKGSEILSMSVLGSFINSAEFTDVTQFFNAWEIGGDISLEIPRILFPIKTNKFIKKEAFPKTNISAGISLQKNIGLDKQKLTGIIGYSWNKSKKVYHNLELMNVQFIKNLNSEDYFNIFASENTKLANLTSEIPAPSNAVDTDGSLIPLEYASYVLDPVNGFQLTNPEAYLAAGNVVQRREIITEDVVIPSTSYTFIYKNQENYKDYDFSYFRAKLTSTGNLLNAIVKQNEGQDSKQILGTDIAQYIRMDLEYKKFWETSATGVFGLRTFFGAAYPYGNRDEVPFSRSFFIGGPNDLRAWVVYGLGPGSSNSSLEFNVGNLKFLTSLEYRFNVLNSMNAAIFVDAGNIWDISDSSLVTEQEKFKGVKSLEEIAIGSGLGLRYDFSILVLRLDFGFKTYEPYLEGDRWFQNFNIKNQVLNIGINYPF